MFCHADPPHLCRREKERQRDRERERKRWREEGRVLMETPDGAPATTQVSIK